MVVCFLISRIQNTQLYSFFTRFRSICNNNMQVDQQQVRSQLKFKFKILRLLGKGSFGNVYHCLQLANNQEYALKIISKVNVKQSKIQNLKEEAKLLKSLDHSNVVKIFQYGEVESCIYIKMEIATHGNLQNQIERRKKERIAFNDQEIARIMGQIFQGLSYIHSLNIIHRDIKPQNILVTTEKGIQLIKIADFGLSTKLDFHYPKSAIAKCGTLLFMAPQILCKYSYTKAIDVWSASIIMFILFNGSHPLWNNNMTTDQYTAIMAKKISLPNLKNANNLAQNFFNKITKTEPQERYSAQEGLKHPWITRKFTDQIPLAVHQSFSSFTTANQIVSVAKLCISVRNMVGKNHLQVPSSYLIKLVGPLKETYSAATKLKKLKSLNFDRQINYQKGSSRLEDKGPHEKNRIRVISQAQGQNPTINKLNQIFNTLFDKKITNKPKDTMKQKKDVTKQNEAQPIQITQIKDRIQSEIERCVAQVLLNSKRKQKRIFPVKFSPNQQISSEGFIKSSLYSATKASFIRKVTKIKKKTNQQFKIQEK